MPSETDARAERSAAPHAEATMSTPADRAAPLDASRVESSTSGSLPSGSDSTPPLRRDGSEPSVLISAAETALTSREYSDARNRSETRECSDAAYSDTRNRSETRECSDAASQPMEKPANSATTQGAREDGLQLLISLMPQASTTELPASDDEEEFMEHEPEPAKEQPTSRKRAQSDDVPPAQKYRKKASATPPPPPKNARRRSNTRTTDADGFTKATKTAKVAPQQGPAPVGVANSYSALSDSEDEEIVLPPPQQRRTPPPIVIEYKGAFRELQNALNMAIGKNSYTVRAVGEELAKVNIKTTEDYRKVLTLVEERSWNFYTYSADRKKPLKVVFRYLPRSLKPEEIKEDLECMGFVVDEVIKMKPLRTRGRGPLTLVIANNTPENRKLFQLTRIGNVEVRAEELRNKSAYAQCYRCLEPGHVKKYCRMPDYCVKCGENHSTESCALKGVPHQDFTPKCKLCSGAHVASFRGCPVLLSYGDRARGKAQQKPQRNPATSSRQPTASSANKGRRGRRTRRGRGRNADTRAAQGQSHNSTPRRPAPPAPHAVQTSTSNGGQAPPIAAPRARRPPTAGPAASQQQVATHAEPQQRQLAPPPAPQPGTASQPAPPAPDPASMTDFPRPRWRQPNSHNTAVRHAVDRQNGAHAAREQAAPPPAPPGNTGSQPAPPAPAAASMADPPRSRWRLPDSRAAAPRHDVGTRQDGAYRPPAVRHVVGPSADDGRIDRILCCMEKMLQQMSELMAVVQHVASAIKPAVSHHA
ncbi:uncharacterized protein LOC126444220 [Schistocerca serialis cubense]|uniref:uncharacterized protein LOC126444220 n=1 Tax=Schistocerca serialis cubense TaxID=2023355 RepID=UPI00214EC8F9|nr:uncharacterized protein LOC126444220 [Schistocerca serialis cubense]